MSQPLAIPYAGPDRATTRQTDDETERGRHREQNRRGQPADETEREHHQRQRTESERDASHEQRRRPKAEFRRRSSAGTPIAAATSVSQPAARAADH